MTLSRHNRRRKIERRGRPACAAGGFTLVEAAVSTAIVGVLMASALASVGRVAAFKQSQNDRYMAHCFAAQLMAEIASKPYWDPALDAPAGIGASGSELATGDRTLFDDVDDYHGWLESPPALPDGTPLANGTGWYRMVDVAFVYWDDFDHVVGSEYGLKRVSIEVGRLTAGGRADVPADREPVDTLVFVAGYGRGLR